MSDIIILQAIEEPLEKVENHSGASGLIRHLYCSERLLINAPVHIAVHEYVKGVAVSPKDIFTYTSLHTHSFLEVGFTIPKDDIFCLKIKTKNETNTVCGRSTFIIPPSMDHQIEIVEGSGIYVCLILSD